jgi:hypothetical protein
MFSGEGFSDEELIRGVIDECICGIDRSRRGKHEACKMGSACFDGDRCLFGGICFETLKPGSFRRERRKPDGSEVARLHAYLRLIFLVHTQTKSVFA